METEFEIEGVRMKYYMPPELDHHVATELREKIDELIDAYQIRELILDFSRTNFMDSSGIGVVIGRSKKLAYFNGRVTAVNLNQRMDKLFCASGLHRMVEKREEQGNV